MGDFDPQTSFALPPTSDEYCWEDSSRSGSRIDFEDAMERKETRKLADRALVGKELTSQGIERDKMFWRTRSPEH